VSSKKTSPATMPFVKVVKNKAYFKRFQVKYRRRRGMLCCLNFLFVVVIFPFFRGQN
jgi:hypothetical protein